MAQEEIKYTLPSEGGGANDGRQADLIVTYDPAMQNADGSYTLTSATGTYSLLDDGGSVITTYAIVELAPADNLGGNDNNIYLASDPKSSPIVTNSGVSFSISNPNHANITDPSDPEYGQVNFYDYNYNGSPPSDTPRYGELGNNSSAATVSQESAYVCFVSGTLIRTDTGYVAAEDLEVGQRVMTASGRMRPICWLGHRTVDCRGNGFKHNACPIRIVAHAFGDHCPARDLYLSPGHPVLVGADGDRTGGYLVPIMCLINGTTIERIRVNRVTYWHVELDSHDILLAEGLAAESYIDLGSRPWFDSADGALYDPDMTLPGLPGRCRPVAIDGPIVEAERRRLDRVFAMRLAAACAWPSDQTTSLLYNEC